jgi:hypothetical protein
MKSGLSEVENIHKSGATNTRVSKIRPAYDGINLTNRPSLLRPSLGSALTVCCVISVPPVTEQREVGQADNGQGEG